MCAGRRRWSWSQASWPGKPLGNYFLARQLDSGCWLLSSFHGWQFENCTRWPSAEGVGSAWMWMWVTPSYLYRNSFFVASRNFSKLATNLQLMASEISQLSKESQN